MSDLRTRAAQAASPAGDDAGGPARTDDGEAYATPLEEVTYTDPIEDVEMVPVAVGWIRVMRDVKSIDKRSVATIKSEKGSFSFNYRGIDKVLNAVGPALRRHGVFVLPHRVESTYGSAGRMRSCDVTVTYRIYGPQGDYIETQGVGEGLDAGERATPKALTTCYRNMLVVALTIPTEDPKMDPDVVDLKREESRPPTPIEYRDEILNARTTKNRMFQIRAELNAHPAAGGALVAREGGDGEITLLELCTSVGRARFS
jgi:hypothetical protein